ncbi:MAG: DUF1971 domain-containing protein [Acidimicrobiales bacterium]
MTPGRSPDPDPIDLAHPPADEPPTAPPPGLPVGVAWVRTTAVFTAATVPAGLRRAHRVADGVWGVLRVRRGPVRFVIEADGSARDLSASQFAIIEPGVAHHVEPGPDAEFVIDFYR